jgi:hypothetical protein
VAFSELTLCADAKNEGRSQAMRKVKLVMTGLIVVSVFGATVASSASAGWFVEGEELSGSAALATTAATAEATKLSFKGVTTECDGSNLNAVSPQVEGSNKMSAASLTFTGCSASGEGCSLLGSQVGVSSVVAETTAQGTAEVEAIFAPKTGSTFTTIKFTGSKCPIANENIPIKGHVTTTVPTGREEDASQGFLADVSEASGELTAGGSKASFTSDILWTLASGKEWAWQPPGVPVIRAVRLTGEGNSTKECRFKTTGKKCVIRVEIVANPAGRNIEIIDEHISGDPEWTFPEPATGLGMERECKPTLVVGSARNSSCALEVEYIGPANPTRKQFGGRYRVTVKEVGGAQRTATETVLVTAS